MNEIDRRWREGIPHDPRAMAVAREIARIDVECGSDRFDLRFGGDGDNGEELTYVLDIYFAERDAEGRDLADRLDRECINSGPHDPSPGGPPGCYLCRAADFIRNTIVGGPT